MRVFQLASHLSTGAWFSVGGHSEKVGNQRKEIREAIRLCPENSDSQRSILNMLLS